MKKYKIIINYEEDGDSAKYSIKVNGKIKPLPKRLRYWIASEAVMEALRR